MRSIHPPPRVLLRTWAILMLLTAASLMAGRVDETLAPLGIAGAAAVMAAAVFKGRQILLDFLNLRAAPGAWRFLLVGWLVVLALGIVAAYAAAALRAA